MSEPAQQPGKEKSRRRAKKSEEELIITPISIARARHASTYGPSVMDKPQQDAAALTNTPPNQATPPAPTTKPAAKPRHFLDRYHGCLLVAVLCMTFMAGGVLGGVVGGSLLLWANNSNPAALLNTPPTLTPLPTPTPLPVATLTPTPTPEPAATPTIEDIIAAVIPSVVTVINQQSDEVSSRSLFDEGRVVGSGVIVDKRGYIATNNHVIDRPGELRIILADGREAMGELIATNPAEDLALVKIDLADLQPIEWGDSGHARPGQIVYAIGSPLGDFPSSVSFGIISGLNRALEIDKFVIDGLIQTDAAINRGSSGGPLISLQGKVIGINTFIIRESQERGIAEGIAFSIPADTAKSFLIPWIAAHTGESVPIPVSEEGN
jgi:S1-C subfamily serine protease